MANFLTLTSGVPTMRAASPYPAASYSTLSNFQAVYDVVVDSNGTFAYVSGQLSSNSHGAINQIRLSDGAILLTVDLGASVTPAYLAIDTANSLLYSVDSTAGTTWWKINTTTMTTSHTSTLATAVSLTGQPFDLSPDGTIYVYISAVDQLAYLINTSTFAVTTVTVNHSAGANNTSGICFATDSGHVQVAYNTVASVDYYTTAGTYVSTVATGATTPQFTVLRSAPSSANFIALDQSTGNAVVTVASGTPTIYNLKRAPQTLSISTNNTNNLGLILMHPGSNGNYFYAFPIDPTLSDNYVISLPVGLSEQSPIKKGAWFPDDSGRFLALTSGTSPELWTVFTVISLPGASTNNNVLTSDGKGNWVTKTPLITSVSNSDGTLTISPTTGAVVASLASPVSPAHGGTGTTTVPSNGFIPIGNGTTYTSAALTAGANITITNGAGSVTIASTGGSSSHTLKLKTANYTVLSTDDFLDFVITIPVNVTLLAGASGLAGQVFNIKNHNLSTANLTVLTTGTDTIEGSSSFILAPQESLSLMWENVSSKPQWQII